jgi:curved DNA-binding protein CbpA
MFCAGVVHRAYRKLALKHHPDKALRQCCWSPRLGTCGVAASGSSVTATETHLKAYANEVFAFLNAAHEQLINASSRRQVRASAVLWP